MLESLPVRRHVRRLTMLALAALALAAVPAHVTRVAAVNSPLQDEDLVDFQAEFAQGTLQRLAVNPGKVPAPNNSPPFGDDDGMLQLAPIGGLNPATWQPTIQLPQPRAQIGVTTIGNRLFVIGGAQGLVAGQEGFASSAYWAKLNAETGAVVNHGLTAAPPGADIATSPAWVNDPLVPVRAFTNLGTIRDAYPDCVDVDVKERAGPAVASFTASNGKSYIYVIGGVFTLTGCGTANLSTPAVQIGEFNPATNDILWGQGETQRANYIPNQDLPAFDSWTGPWNTSEVPVFGVEQATASVVTVGSTTYIYVIGGLINYTYLGDNGSMATPAVWYAKINPATGALEAPSGGQISIPGSPWARTANVPLNLLYNPPSSAPDPGDLGIYAHTTIVSKAVVGSGASATTTPVIYVTGGYTSPALGAKAANATVFRAKINATNGALTWDTDLYAPLPTNETVTTEGIGRAGAGGFAFDNKLYVLGGIRNADTTAFDPFGNATLAAHNDKLDLLPIFGDTPPRTFFFGSNEADAFTPVYGIGAAVIPATPPANATTIDAGAYGYVVGGFDTGDKAVTTVYSGKLAGSSEASGANIRRLPDGWYYSKYFPIRMDSNDPNDKEAKIVSITWFSGIDRTNPNADIKLEFRRTRLLPCNEAAFTGAGTEWQTLDAVAGSPLYSKAGEVANEIKLSDVPGLADPIASCMQFRVYMTQNGTTADGLPIAPAGGGTSLSPKLYRVAIQKIKPGDPDLFIESFTLGPNAKGQMSNFDLKIKNLNGTVLSTSGYSGDQFPVVLCVGRVDLDQDPNFTFTPPSLPIVNDPDNRVNCAPLYRWVDATETIPGQTFTLNDNWRVNFANYYTGRAVDSLMNPVINGFATPGHYAVTAIIDPFNLVQEAGQGKANNRGENLNNGQPLVRRFTITDAPNNSIYLPTIGRP